MRKLLVAAAMSLLAIPAQAQQAVVRQSALVDGSGTVTTGGTSQQVFAANPARSYLFCQNPIAASEPLMINIGAAASTTAASYELAAGGTMTFQVPFVPTGVVNITAATTAHRFICKQG